MRDEQVMRLSERWFRLLLRLYPADFRDDAGEAIVDAYQQRAAALLRQRRRLRVGALWVRALADAGWNGPAERVRPAAFWRRHGNWGRDLEMARRRLMRAPLFVVLTIATLTIGLGAFAVVFTAVDKILIEPLPYRSPQNLYWVWRDQAAASGLTRDWLAGPDVAELQRAGGVIEGAAGTQIVSPTIAAAPDSEPLQARVVLTSPNLFQLLGSSPMLGRAFTPQEVGPNRPSVIILSHAMWNRLGADRGIVGRQVWLSGSAYTVVGVMGPDFPFVRQGATGAPIRPDAYMPFRFFVADQDPNSLSFSAVVRARAGTSPQQVADAVAAAGRAARARHPNSVPFRLLSVGLHDDLVARVRTVLLTIGIAGAFLLLVLTVNFASLLLARAAGREREFAVARAIGANGIAIVRAMLLEGVLLGMSGGIGGAMAGRWGTQLLMTLAPLDLPRHDSVVLDWPVAAAVVGIGAVIGVIAAWLPATWASRRSLASLLSTASVRGAGTTPMRRTMIVAQVAISLVLLSAGGLLVRSFAQLLAAQPGFESRGVLTFTVAMGPRLFPQPDAAMAFQERLDQRLRALPGVVDVSATTVLPLSALAPQGTVTAPSAPGNTGSREHDAPMVDVIDVRAHYTAVMGMTVVLGRPFEDARREGVKEALIDTHLSQTFFATGSPLGRTVVFNNQPLTIVGVVRQARLYDVHADGRPQLYVRAEDWTPYTPFFTVRTSGDPRALAAAIPAAVRQADARIAVSAIRPLDEIVEDSIRQPRITTVLIAGFALGALLLVAMGLFGMVSGSVTQRHGELAVRLALGATHGGVLRLVVGEGALLVAIGMVIAVPGIYIAGQLLRGLLIDVSPLDPSTLIGVAAGLALITIAACYMPARRVLRIDPAPLLRRE
jgi:predicted permease